MARITIEDCTEKVPNRFQLVQMAAIRSKQLKKGATAMLKSEENKEVVMALREIAAGYVAPDYPEDLQPDGSLESDDSQVVAEVAAPAAEPTEEPSA